MTDRRTRLYQGIWGKCLAEFLGTAVLVLLGCGSVAVAVVGLPGTGRTAGPTIFFQGSGDWLIIVWGWAFAVAFGVYVCQGVSGAHINPAVTLAFAIRRRFPWKHVIPYWIAQTLGAIGGAAIVLGLYTNAMNTFDQQSETFNATGHTIPTLSIFSTFPAPYFHGGIWGPLVDQIVGTAMLMLAIAAVIDIRNKAVKANLGPLIIGFSVAAIGISIGSNAGYAINPARDLGPRIIAWLGGWGELAFPGNGPWFDTYFWIPIVGPLIGGIVGILVYDLFIGDVLHAMGRAKERPPVGRVAERPVVDDDE
ncbi:MIP/aquaporin family protein [Pseudactinotalea sp. HY158]|uniref:MIP/aquaporin family protein n=1 Tax=Pseudactinotalea sp. HY158 TaxID=2654547 RepID=UPI001E429CEF|nr:MIP/aquaporin family protein [Pseudactinotalea sp. HY158]